MKPYYVLLVRKEENFERHHTRRRLRHTIISTHNGYIKTAAPRLQQADDLLSAVDSYACRYQGHTYHFHA